MKAIVNAKHKATGRSSDDVAVRNGNMFVHSAGCGEFGGFRREFRRSDRFSDSY